MFDLPEQITVWKATANDGLGGKTWSAPVVHASRNSYSRQQFTDDRGDTHTSTAVAYTRGIVDVGDLVLLGAESDATEPPPEANDVRAIDEQPKKGASPGDLRKLWFA